MDGFFVISGCSGGGKSALLAELQARGHRCIAEPGRRIVARELAMGGTNLPWRDLAGFARAARDLACADYEAALAGGGSTFFDRSLIDALAALTHATGEAPDDALLQRHRYDSPVFFVPPWPEIYVTDNERRHDLASAIDEYERLGAFYRSLGYRIHCLPKIDVAGRADRVLAVLDLP